VRRCIDGLIQVRLLGRRPLFAFDLVLILTFIIIQASIVVAVDFLFAAGLLLLVALARASLRSLLAVFAFAILASILVQNLLSSRASIFFVVFGAVLDVEGGWGGRRENLRGSALADETAPERSGR
jgi:predicted membrane protein